MKQHQSSHRLKQKILYPVILLAVMISSLLLFHPQTSAASSRIYTIDISKVSATTAEKKLCKIKPNDKRTLQFKIKAKNGEDADRKLRAWLLKFQKAPANKYGTLPCAYTLYTPTFRKLKNFDDIYVRCRFG